ncbi:hypothetical protein ACFW04_011589 [Cataglyphis niger]
MQTIPSGSGERRRVTGSSVKYRRPLATDNRKKEREREREKESHGRVFARLVGRGEPGACFGGSPAGERSARGLSIRGFADDRGESRGGGLQFGAGADVAGAARVPRRDSWEALCAGSGWSRVRTVGLENAREERRTRPLLVSCGGFVQRGGGSRKRKIPAAEHASQTRNNQERSEENESENRAANLSPVTEEAEEEEEAEIPHQRQQQQQVSNNFSNINLLAENTRQFRRFGITGREASFAIRPTKHECGVSYCKLCQSPKPENHLCYMQSLRHIDDSSNELLTSSSTSATVPSKKERVAFVFYDFETRQDETLEGTTIVKKHIPTLCVAQQICEACAKENNLSVRCRWCGVREFVFLTKCFKQIICIAHNAKAFAQFILKYIVENRNNLEPKLILSGTKIVVLTVSHTKFIDSVNYMPMRLSDLPKAFGLQSTSDKGIFPHLF